MGEHIQIAQTVGQREKGKEREREERIDAEPLVRRERESDDSDGER